MINKKLFSLIANLYFAFECFWNYSKFETIFGIFLRIFSGFTEVILIALIFPVLYQIIGLDIAINSRLTSIMNYLYIDPNINNGILISYLISFLIFSTILRVYTIHHTNKFSYDVASKVSNALMIKLLTNTKPFQNYYQNSKLLLILKEQPILLPIRLFIPFFQIIGSLMAIVPVVIFLLLNSIESLIFSLPLIFINYLIFYLFIRSKVKVAGKKYDINNCI